MLAMALPMAKELGILRVLVTCDDNNLGSIKTIEANGGRLENKVEVGEGKPLKRRYWIELK
jgi:predicted acetyltransferase